jgi:predicted Fe-Mo cluster-binding NifX family protein
MNIAIAAMDSTLDGMVSAEFAQTPYVLIVTVETMVCTPIAHVVSPGSDCALARTALAHRCEALIANTLTEKAFNILADDGVTRYAATDMSAREALEAMERRELEVIRNPDGSGACSGSHHH